MTPWICGSGFAAGCLVDVGGAEADEDCETVGDSGSVSMAGGCSWAASHAGGGGGDLNPQLPVQGGRSHSDTLRAASDRPDKFPVYKPVTLPDLLLTNEVWSCRENPVWAAPLALNQRDQVFNEELPAPQWMQLNEH